MSMSDKKIKTVWKQGPIAPDFIADSIAKHQSKTQIGAWPDHVACTSSDINIYINAQYICEHLVGFMASYQ